MYIDCIVMYDDPNCAHGLVGSNFRTVIQVEWLEECCTEFNVLEGSSRERMCNSVLTPEQVKRLSEYNTVAREGTDVPWPFWHLFWQMIDRGAVSLHHPFDLFGYLLTSKANWPRT